MIKEWIPDAVYPCESRGRNDRKMIWIPDAVYPCEACPCEACPCESREQGVGAGMIHCFT